MWASGADRQWTQRCSEENQGTAAHWSFYIFSLEPPLLTHLEQFDVSTDTLPGEALRLVQQTLEARLTARYGPSEDHSPANPRVRIVPWRSYVSWRSGDLEVQLNLSEFDPKRNQGRLSLVMRHRLLLDALADDERLKKIDMRAFVSQIGSPIDEDLARELRDFPEIATILTHQQPPPDPAQMRAAVQQIQDQLRAQAFRPSGPRAGVLALPQARWTPEQFHQSLVRLLTSARTAAPERQPVFLLAADRLAWRLPVAMANDKFDSQAWNQWREELAKLGVTYHEPEIAPLADTWPYRGDLLKQVWANYRQTLWGERAFLLLLNQGFDTSSECETGSDSFRAVIEQGEQFLNDHPGSPHLPAVELSLGQAYETWWSLSQARPEDSEINPEPYQTGASRALESSIDYYQRLLAASPESDDAAYARRELPRLMLGRDTGQRRFYCTVGD